MFGAAILAGRHARPEPVARRAADGRLRIIGLGADIQLRVVGPEQPDRFGNRDDLLVNLNAPADNDSRIETRQGHEL
jgi:hypothetical protein